MKRFCLITFLIVATAGFAQNETSNLNWLTDLDIAKKVSKEEGKSIMVYFTGSDWCTPCVALKKDFFETDDFAERAKNLVLVMIDYPRRVDIISEAQLAYNKKIIEKYNREKSFPNVVMLNKNGNILGNLSGYSSYNTYHDTSHHYAFVDKYVSRNN